MTSLTDQNDNTTFFAYDARGLITSTTDPFNPCLSAKTHLFVMFVFFRFTDGLKM
jgi:YD repeat-containing protein